LEIPPPCEEKDLGWLHYLYGQVIMLIICFKSDKIIPYIEVIRDDINELDLQSHLIRENEFIWVLTINCGF
jgi:hypothetical protein